MIFYVCFELFYWIIVWPIAIKGKTWKVIRHYMAGCSLYSCWIKTAWVWVSNWHGYESTFLIITKSNVLPQPSYMHTYIRTYIHTAFIHAYVHTHIHTHIHTYMFVVVNFDALAQASDIRIERRQVVFLCWMQDSNPSGSQTPNRQQTECPLTNRLSYRGSSKNVNSTARPCDQRAFSPLDPIAVWHSHLDLAIYIFVVVNFDALTQASDIRIERRQVVFLCWMQDSNPPGSQAHIRTYIHVSC